MLYCCYIVNEFPPSTGGWQNHAYNLAHEIGKDHQVTAIRQAVARDYEMLQNDSVLEWTATNMKELVRRR